jgi:hypothetical protein
MRKFLAPMLVAFPLLGAVGTQAAIGSLNAASLGPSFETDGATPRATIETIQYMPRSGFPYPQMRGAIVDWCAVWAHGCGRDGADQFCQRKGFDHALYWQVFHPGHTFVIGTQQFCNGDGCRGFRFVRCD